MGRPRRKPQGFRAGQLVEPTENYAGDVDGVPYVGIVGVTRLDGDHPAVRAWPHLHKLLDPGAYKDEE